jgi:hypothetical protein
MRASSLTVGCDVFSSAAASVTLPVCMMARNTSMWRSVRRAVSIAYPE